MISRPERTDAVSECFTGASQPSPLDLELHRVAAPPKLDERLPLMDGTEEGPTVSPTQPAPSGPASRPPRPPQQQPARGAPPQDVPEGLDLEDVLHSANSFWAVLKPVALTMTLASLVVVNISQGAGNDGGNDQSMSVYTVYNDDGSGGGGDSTSVKLGKSLINALVIVGTICVATFLVVCLYKFRCMKVLVGYMAFSCVMLLGLMGGLLWLTALERWELPCDFITYFFVLYNFAVVGVIAIFYQKGIPTLVTQGYLVMISVIMAWQLSRFEEWTGWCLLVVLALYDLCAVLTPCGPLRYLVGLMQEYNEPMPGLLYEAELPPPGGARPNQPRAGQPSINQAPIPVVQRARPPQPHASADLMTDRALIHRGNSGDGDAASSVLGGGEQQSPDGPQLRGGAGWATAERQAEETRRSPTPDELIRTSASSSIGTPSPARADSRLLPTRSDDDIEAAEFEDEGRSIKLGLGDFVFYSVLVSKAALYGFATCAACFLVIITGLGATLVLLSVYRKALPALPISIGLGVVFYLLTRTVIIPYIAQVASGPIYV